MTNKKETQLTMDYVLKMQPEIFRDIMKAQTLGFNKSLLNLLKLQFEQCTMVKESITNLYTKGAIPKEEEDEYKKAVKDLFICMQLIEDRYTILDIIIKEVEESK